MTSKRGSPPPPELPWSLHKSPGWQGQYDRMLRWHRRLHSARQPDEVEDYLYAFFVTCAHVRDWLLATKAVPQRDLEAFCSREDFRLCQDFCNATKHFSLSDPKQGREFSLAREYVGAGRGRFGGDTTLTLLSRGKQHDAFDLADRCVDQWRGFLRTHGHDV
jgi:hypothetical protein